MRHETLLTQGRVVTPDGVLDPGWVAVADGRIAAVGAGAAGARGSHRAQPAGVELDGAWLLPGFVDLHMHGGGGHNATASPEDMAAAVAFHRGHGTTRTLVSLVAAPLELLAEQLGWVADVVNADPQDGQVVGAHLEGPFLSAVRCGAQPPEHLRDPDRAVFAELLRAGRGTVCSVTIAPELPGALAVVADAVAAGAVAAIGHTDATYEQATAAITAGATLATHLFNGMRPLHHRDPGPVGAALAAGIACELINDGVHVHPWFARLVASDPRRLVLVTDAIAAAGAGDGAYTLGGRPVRVRGGEARLEQSDLLAGSTLTMDDAVRRAVVDGGLPIEVAAAAASTNPARVLGLSGRCGAIRAGLDADLVVLDADLHLIGVMVRGQWSGGQAIPDRLAGATR